MVSKPRRERAAATSWAGQCSWDRAGSPRRNRRWRGRTPSAAAWRLDRRDHSFVLYRKTYGEGWKCHGVSLGYTNATPTPQRKKSAIGIDLAAYDGRKFLVARRDEQVHLNQAHHAQPQGTSMASPPISAHPAAALMSPRGFRGLQHLD